MGFVLGLVISTMLIVCIILEMCEVVRPIFSVLLLMAVVALGVAVFFVGMLFTPLFIFGFVMGLPVLLFAALIGGKDAK